MACVHGAGRRAEGGLTLHQLLPSKSLFTVTCLRCTRTIVVVPIIRDDEIHVLRDHANGCVRELDARSLSLADLLKLFGVTMAERA